MKGCLLDTSAPALPPPLKLKAIDAGADGAGVDDCPKANIGGTALGSAVGAVGGVLGAAPNEKGVDGFASSVGAAGCPNEKAPPPKSGLSVSTAGELVAADPKLNGFGASVVGGTAGTEADAVGAPKVNGRGDGVDCGGTVVGNETAVGASVRPLVVAPNRGLGAIGSVSVFFGSAGAPNENGGLDAGFELAGSGSVGLPNEKGTEAGAALSVVGLPKGGKADVVPPNRLGVDFGSSTDVGLVSPTQNGFSLSLTGLEAGVASNENGVVESGGTGALMVAPKFSTGGGVGRGGVSLRTDELAKKFGMPLLVGTGAAADFGAILKKGGSDAAGFGSGVGAFAGGARLDAVDGKPRPNEDAEGVAVGLKVLSNFTGSVEVKLGVGTDAEGLENENGKDLIGGSLSFSVSGWIGAGVSFAKEKPAGIEKTGTFLAASSRI